jgi:hypothetical protein
MYPRDKEFRKRLTLRRILMPVNTSCTVVDAFPSDVEIETMI